MKKSLVALAILVGVLSVLVFAGSVFAQADQPGTGQGQGLFGMGWHGMMGRGAEVAPGGGLLHDYMLAAYADALNLTVDELQARLDSGDRIIDIAIDQGLTLAEFRDLKTSVRQTAIDNALADGVITQEQADLMKTRPAFGGHRGHGMRAGFGGDCPNMTP